MPGRAAFYHKHTNVSSQGWLKARDRAMRLGALETGWEQLEPATTIFLRAAGLVHSVTHNLHTQHSRMPLGPPIGPLIGRQVGPLIGSLIGPLLGPRIGRGSCLNTMVLLERGKSGAGFQCAPRIPSWGR